MKGANKLEPRSLPMRREQKLFLDLFSGKRVGPSPQNGDGYSMDPAKIAEINLLHPKNRIYQNLRSESSTAVEHFLSRK
jgi:hypothetical protein